jgi:hypothetical protein
MTIVDAFDIHDLEHIKAYKSLCDGGMWPDGFKQLIGADEPPPTTWFFMLTNKMANAWVEQKLKEQE